MAEIFDLRDKIGREAYFNHLKRKLAGQSLPEILFQTAVFELRTLALRHTIKWIENCLDEVFEEASNLKDGPDPDTEKFLGPEWRKALKEILKDE